MAQPPSKGPIIQVKPQPGIYTVMLIVASAALAVTIGIVMYNLMSPVTAADGSAGGYGLSFGEMFDPLKKLIPGQ